MAATIALEKRLDLLIRRARARVGDQEYNVNQGVAQRDYVGYANDAQTRVMNLMQQAHPSLFNKQGFLDSVAGQAAYDLPTNIWLNHNLIKAEFTPTGSPQLYTELDLRTPTSEVSVRGYPDSYFLRAGQMIVSPMPPSSIANAFRLEYQRDIPEIDIRRAKIASTAGSITSIVLTADATLLTETENDLAEGWVDYVSVVDKDGVQTATEIAVVSYDTATKELEVSATLDAGESVAIGSYIVFGKNATTHAQLPKVCERYLVEYMVMRAQVGSTSTAAMATNPILQAIEAEIVASVEDLEEGVIQIPIANYDYVDNIDDDPWST